MKAYIFDPGLEGFAGHHYLTTGGFRRVLMEKGYDVEVFASCEGFKDFDYPVQKAFSNTIYNFVKEDDATNYKLSYESLNNSFVQDFEKINIRIEPEDVLLFHTVNINVMYAISEFLSAIDSEQFPNVFILLPFCDFIIRNDNLGFCGRETYQELFASFPCHKKIHFLTTGENLKLAFEALSKREFHIFPMPQSQKTFLDNVKEKQKTDRLTVSFFGHARKSKGLLLLPGIVRSISRKYKNIDFHIQISSPEQHSDLVDLLSRRRNVTLYTEYLSEQAYVEAFNKSDIVMIPYDQPSSRWITSGIFSEAMMLGKVIVLPEGTWMHQEGEKFDGGIIPFSDFSTAGVSSSVEKAIENFDAYKKKAQSVATSFREWHSVKNFVDQMMKMIEGNAS